MKLTNIVLVAVTVISITNCKTKKSTSTSSTVASTTTPAASGTTSTTPKTSYSTFSTPVMLGDGIYEPGEKEVKALQMQYADITLEKLKEGHQLYTTGACINCHGAKNIYKRPESRWKDIIDNMAKMAKLNEAQTDAVYKYVMAIKANQPK